MCEESNVGSRGRVLGTEMEILACEYCLTQEPDREGQHHRERRDFYLEESVRGYYEDKGGNQYTGKEIENRS